MVKQVILPNRLPVLRAERRLSQLRLAKKSRITHNRYWRIENGKADATDRERARLASALGVTDADIWPAAVVQAPAAAPDAAETVVG